MTTRTGGVSLLHNSFFWTCKRGEVRVETTLLQEERDKLLAPFAADVAKVEDVTAGGFNGDRHTLSEPVSVKGEQTWKKSSIPDAEKLGLSIFTPRSKMLCILRHCADGAKEKAVGICRRRQ